jgi:hypothetical protein
MSKKLTGKAKQKARKLRLNKDSRDFQNNYKDSLEATISFQDANTGEEIQSLQYDGTKHNKFLDMTQSDDDELFHLRVSCNSPIEEMTMSRFMKESRSNMMRKQNQKEPFTISFSLEDTSFEDEEDLDDAMRQMVFQTTAEMVAYCIDNKQQDISSDLRLSRFSKEISGAKTYKEGLKLINDISKSNVQSEVA